MRRARAPALDEVGDITLDFPTRLDAITFGHSDRDPRLQVADIVAGSAAHIYAVATGARPMDALPDT